MGFFKRISKSTDSDVPPNGGECRCPERPNYISETFWRPMKCDYHKWLATPAGVEWYTKQTSADALAAQQEGAGGASNQWLYDEAGNAYQVGPNGVRAYWTPQWQPYAPFPAASLHQPPQWDPNAYPQGLKTSLYYPGPYQGQPQVVGDQQQPYEQLGPDSTMNSEVPSQANTNLTAEPASTQAPTANRSTESPASSTASFKECGTLTPSTVDLKVTGSTLGPNSS